MKKNRRKARELAVQGLYQRQLTGDPVEIIEAQLREHEDFEKIDGAHFSAILHGAINEVTNLESRLRPCLDRPIEDLSPVERAVLMVATYEFAHHVEIPYRVVINEAIELAKCFGGSDGYKYVNGVLDKLAASERAVEVGASKGR
ncbi:MAG: transcription antitermination factor NusB [Sulfurimicrobium sp.]|jgi:N utilization substance protein B|nr:transcription antitermination factor NusB [Sulfurimicrobium sp.]MDO9189929.1 transcription antitermination factor NusB [Sulfurimicrobium sp.]MDP1704964.1 transcription antitermination factor NusB [Sulfurimicrobium sp.]MDP2198757.1 transcription antitermination factor NusB [Sulfurimicrobium sp.]MDP2964360.1 transcription antitermination factor NusB [Sulfurimicrobium sp.]